MEETLQENLQLLKSIVENTPLPIGVYFGENLKIVLANESMIKTWGKGYDVIGKRYTEILPELDNFEIFNEARAVLSSGVPFHAKNSRVDLVIDGVLEIHYFNYSFIPLKNAEGFTYAIMNTGADVTDLVLANKNTEEAEEKLRLAIAAGELGTYVVDLSTNEVKTSEKFNQIWGIEGTTLERNDIIAKIVPEDLPIREDAYKKATTSGNIYYEIRLSKGDSYRWVRVKGRISKSESTNSDLLVGVVQDITEQKEFSEELQKLVAERTLDLQKSNDELEQFANIVSHDLKEPVRKIAIFSNLLKNDLDENLQERDVLHFNKIAHSTKRMNSIIEDVLTYSKLNKSGHPVTKIDLNTIIEEIKTDLELVIDEKKAQIIKDDLPQIDAAPILIHQLFYNLIHNALKFAKTDVAPRITISSSTFSENDKEFVRISIKDNGVGFDTSYAKKIFEAFKRLHSKDEYEGTGLGLSLCKKIVERHNGTIKAFGNTDEGSEFIVSLPIKQERKKF